MDKEVFRSLLMSEFSVHKKNAIKSFVVKKLSGIAKVSKKNIEFSEC